MAQTFCGKCQYPIGPDCVGPTGPHVLVQFNVTACYGGRTYQPGQQVALPTPVHSATAQHNKTVLNGSY